MDTKIIFEASIHHTGTNFVHGLLIDNSFESRTGYFGNLGQGIVSDTYHLRDKYKYGCFCANGFYGLLNLMKTRLEVAEKEEKKNIDIGIFHTHFGEGHERLFLSTSFIEYFSRIFKITHLKYY